MSDKAKHSPGPWRATEDEYGGYVYDRDGTPAAFAYGPCMPFETPEEARNIALNTQLANTLLIAAAPDLLKAAKNACDHLVHTTQLDCDCDGCNAFRALAAAIAKATGPKENDAWAEHTSRFGLPEESEAGHA